MVTQGQKFEGMRVVADGESFKGCTFKNCRMVYAGGAFPFFSECVFDDSPWIFEGPARNGIEFLKALYAGGDHRALEMVVEYIKNVEAPQPVESGVRH